MKQIENYSTILIKYHLKTMNNILSFGSFLTQWMSSMWHTFQCLVYNCIVSHMYSFAVYVI